MIVSHGMYSHMMIVSHGRHSLVVYLYKFLRTCSVLLSSWLKIFFYHSRSFAQKFSELNHDALLGLFIKEHTTCLPNTQVPSALTYISRLHASLSELRRIPVTFVSTTKFHSFCFQIKGADQLLQQRNRLLLKSWKTSAWQFLLGARKCIHT